jgi:hypothetical protein
MAQVSSNPVATDVRVAEGLLKVFLADGRSVRVPLDRLPLLARASRPLQRAWRLLEGGRLIRWDAAGTEVRVAELLSAQPRPRIVRVRLMQEEIRVTLTDGREVRVPLRWFPRLHGDRDVLWGRWRCDGHGLYWEEIDLLVTVEDLLAQ